MRDRGAQFQANNGVSREPALTVLKYAESSVFAPQAPTAATTRRFCLPVQTFRPLETARLGMAGMLV
jgi:hypothetical protein